MRSDAFDIVEAANHPDHADGGPCHECAFRRGTEANRSEHTTTLAALCVEGLRPFYCHVHPGLCRGFFAAANLRGAPATDEDRRHAEAAGLSADMLSDAITTAVAVQSSPRGAARP